MSLMESFREECIKVHSDAPDKDVLLREVALLAKNCQALSGVPQETILDGLRKREELGSTGFQNGIAIPHCLLPNADEFIHCPVHNRTTNSPE